jgi:serine/threonine protein phosphatase PrpC
MQLKEEQYRNSEESMKFFILSRESEKNSFFSIFRELPEYSLGIFVEKNGNSQENIDIANVIGNMLDERLRKNPTLDRKKLEVIIYGIHNEYKKRYGAKDKNSCSIIVFITDYKNIVFVNIGGLKYLLLKDKEIFLKNREHTIAYLMYEAKKIEYDEIKKRRDRNTLTHKFGVDKGVMIDITDPIPLKKDDKIVVYNNDIWDLIDENDIVDVKVNRLKKLFSNKDDYLFFTGTILKVEDKKENISSEVLKKERLNNRYKMYLGIAFLIIGIILGVKTYIAYKTANDLYATAVKKETLGNVEFENENYKGALEEYRISFKNYSEYYEYSGKVDNGKIEYMDNLIAQTANIVHILDKLEEAEESLYEENFRKALKDINLLNMKLQNMKNKERIEEKVITLYSTALILNIAYENKITADKLLEDYYKNPIKNENLKKKAEDLYEKSALVFLENSFMDLYEEIAYKEALDIESVVKYKNTSEIIRMANKAFRDFKYYKSLKLYTSALKSTKNLKTIEMLNHKIKMNDIVLKGVKAELSGDKIKRNALDDRDMRKAIDKYKEAEKYYSILENNASISKVRYNMIIERIHRKIEGK